MNDAERWRELVKWLEDNRPKPDVNLVYFFGALIDKIRELKK